MARALLAPAAPRRAAWLSRAAQAAYAAGGALAAVQLLRLGARLVRAQVRRNGALWAAGARRQSSLWTYPLEEDNTPTGCLNAVGIRVSGRCALSSNR